MVKRIKQFGDVDLKFERETAIRNRGFILKEFNDYLLELNQKDNEFDNREFILAAIFREIRNQKIFIAKNLPFVDINEEKEILKQMIKDTKNALKREYTALYKEYNK